MHPALPAVRPNRVLHDSVVEETCCWEMRRNHAEANSRGPEGENDNNHSPFSGMFDALKEDKGKLLFSVVWRSVSNLMSETLSVLTGHSGTLYLIKDIFTVSRVSLSFSEKGYSIYLFMIHCLSLEAAILKCESAQGVQAIKH